MEPDGSLLHSYEPATRPSSEPYRSNPCPPRPTTWRSILILYSHLRLCLPSGLFPWGFPTRTLWTPLLSSISATCPAHFILLDFITRTILGEEYRSLSWWLKFHECCRTVRCITVFTRAHQMPLSWAGSLHTSPSHLSLNNTHIKTFSFRNFIYSVFTVPISGRTLFF